MKVIYTRYTGEDLIYAVSDASIEEVCDRDIPLTWSGVDVKTLDDLKRLHIEPGYWASCQRLGLIRLGAVPDGIVTGQKADDGETRAEIGRLRAEIKALHSKLEAVAA